MAACYSDLSKTGVYIFPDRLQKNYKQYLSYKTDTQNWSVTPIGPFSSLGSKSQKIAGIYPLIDYQFNPGQILPHFYVKNTFLAQKLTKLEHFKEIPEKLVEKSLKIKIPIPLPPLYLIFM